MRQFWILAAACLLVAVIISCNQQITAPPGEAIFEGLEFSSAELRLDQPFALIGRASTVQPIGPHPVLVRTDSGARLEVHLKSPREGPSAFENVDGQAASRAYWAAFSNEELAELITEAPNNRVAVGFKEAEAEWGVDTQGLNITSSGTAQRMKQWLEERGVEIIRESLLIPSVTGEMAPDAQLVGEIRGHDNIDYLQPLFPGERQEGSTDLHVSVFVAVIVPGIEGQLPLRVGDRITAHYRQPDGSELTAAASVRR
jgi:hypothetical protein